MRQSLSDAETTLREAEERLKVAQRDLEDLSKPDKFGKDGEWKKLDKLCLEKNTGECVPSTTFCTRSFTLSQIHVRGLPFRGSKAKSELRWLCALPWPLLLLEKR
jgi:hypothetical protein